MTLKKMIGYTLMAPMVLIPIGLACVFVYSWFVFHPIIMTFIALFIAFIIGKFLIFVDDEEKKDKKG